MSLRYCKENKMPIYTYRCENCGEQFELRQSFSDVPLTVCPKCNQEQLRKVITPAGIVFKGSGWYVTDHKSKSSSGTSSSSTKTGGESKGEGKDATPVATPTAESGSSSSGGDSSTASKASTSTSSSNE
jgi:putative FmdB family regulatory protein